MRSESKSGPMKFASASYDNFIFTKQLTCYPIFF